MVAGHVYNFFIELMRLVKIKTLDPGLRRDDVLKIVGLKIIIPAQGEVGN